MQQHRREKCLQLILSAILFSCACALLLWAMRDSMNSYYTPSEALNHVKIGKTFQLGGLVKAHSLTQDKEGCVAFSITDKKATISTHFCGLLPTLFREGQGVIATGVLDDNNQLEATRLLAKHDEYYRPPGIGDQGDFS